MRTVLILVVFICFGCQEKTKEYVATENFERQEQQLLDSLHSWGMTEEEFICILSNKYFCSACIHPDVGPGLAYSIRNSSASTYVVTTNSKLSNAIRPHIAEEQLIFRNTRFLDTLDFPIYDWTIVKVDNKRFSFVVHTKSLNELKATLDTVVLR